MSVSPHCRNEQLIKHRGETYKAWVALEKVGNRAIKCAVIFDEAERYLRNVGVVGHIAAEQCGT
jgi:hypothetical protein